MEPKNKNKRRIIIEAGGEMLLSNIWVKYTRIIMPEEWALLSKEEWDEIREGAEAGRVLSDLIDEVIKTLRGQAHRGEPPYVSWLRVETVED